MSKINAKIVAAVSSLFIVLTAGTIHSQQTKNLDTVGAIIEFEDSVLNEKSSQIENRLEEEKKEREMIEQARENYYYLLYHTDIVESEPDEELVVEQVAYIEPYSQPESYSEPDYEQEVASDSDAGSTEVSLSDIELIALITMAEAEGEPVEGQRLVIDTILNRVDNPAFPNTVYDVIYQPGQFTCVWNGRLSRCYVSEDICQLVREELESRYSYDTIYFCAGGYSGYGQRLFQVGNHYFSSF